MEEKTGEQGEATLNWDIAEMEERIRHTTSAVLTELRLEGQLCDVVIKVDNVEFNAHKIILCGCSPYFRWVDHLSREETYYLINL